MNPDEVRMWVYEETLRSGEQLTDVINRTNVRTSYSFHYQWDSIFFSVNITIILTTPRKKLNITVSFGRKMSNIFLESSLAKMLLQIQTLKVQVFDLVFYLFILWFIRLKIKFTNSHQKNQIFKQRKGCKTLQVLKTCSLFTFGVHYAVKDSNMLVFVTPHQFMEGICKRLVGKIREDAEAISLVKGMEVKMEGPCMI